MCINKFILCRDNIPAILLAEWDLSTEYFDEDFLSGIMPVLFARDPRAAEAGIKANPETAMKDLDKLNRIFFIPESAELDGAPKIVKRARLGDVDFVFKRKNLDRVFEPEPFIQGETQIITFEISKLIKITFTYSGPSGQGSARTNLALFNLTGSRNS